MKVLVVMFVLCFLSLSQSPRTITECPAITSVIPTGPDGKPGGPLGADVCWAAAVSNTVPPESIKYVVEVSEAENFSNMIHTSNALTGETCYGLPTLKINKLYYVRVMASDNNFLTICYSKTASFRTPAPYNLRYITSLPRKLDWNGVSTATSYCVKVSTNPSYTNLAVDECGITNSEFPVDLPPGLYFMKVNATNTADTGDFTGSVEINSP